jgi:antitoxin Xre/MbcA/ParS-like protein
MNSWPAEPPSSSTAPRVPSETAVLVVGQRNAFTKRLEAVLHKHTYSVSYCSLSKFERGFPHPHLPELAPENSSIRQLDIHAGGHPRYLLCVFNLLPRTPVAFTTPGTYSVYRTETANKHGWWKLAVERFHASDPRAPILAALDDHDTELVVAAMRAGVDDILGRAEAMASEVIHARIEAVFARRYASDLALWVTETCSKLYAASACSPDQISQTWIDSRRSVIDRNVREGQVFVAPAATHDVIADARNAPAPPDDRMAALARVRAAAQHLPTPEERARPIASRLGVTSPHLRAKSGRLDARKIAARLSVSLNRLAAAVPISRQALRAKPDSPRAQVALDPIARVLDILEVMLPGQQMYGWLQTPHIRLDGKTPLQAMLDGQAERVARMLEIARGGGVE